MKLSRIAARSVVGRVSRGAGAPYAWSFLFGQWLVPRKRRKP